MLSYRALLITALVGAVPSSPAFADWNPKKTWDESIDKVEARRKTDVRIFNKALDDAKQELARAEANIRNLSPKGVSEELWGECGRYAYVAAAGEMRDRARGEEKSQGDLTNQQKLELYEEFGGLVNQVRLHWGVRPVDTWKVGDVTDRLGVKNPLYAAALSQIKDVKAAGSETEAQTYGYDIYIKLDKSAYDGKPPLSLLQLLAHEMQHARQFERAGNSLSEFGYQYFKAYKKANLVYENNAMEREAIEVEKRTATKPPVDWKDAPVNGAAEKIEYTLLKLFEDKHKKALQLHAAQQALNAVLLLTAQAPIVGDNPVPEGWGGDQPAGYIKEFIVNQPGEESSKQVRFRLHGEKARVYCIFTDHNNPNGAFASALILQAAASNRKVFIVSASIMNPNHPVTEPDFIRVNELSVPVSMPSK